MTKKTENLPATTTGSVLDRIKAKPKKDVSKMLGGNASIPYMKLIQALSNEAKRKNHTEFFAPEPGDFIAGKIVIGTKTTVIPVDYRAKAISFDGSGDVCYDENDDEYNRIADLKKPDGKSASAYGPEFLFWVIQDDQQFFATLHMKGTAAKAASSFINNMGEVTTLYSDDVKSGDHEWFVPACASSDHALSEADLFTEELLEAATRWFENPYVPAKAEVLSEEAKGGKKRSKR